MPVLHTLTIFRVSRVQAAETIAFVEAIAGMMFFTTPWYEAGDKVSLAGGEAVVVCQTIGTGGMRARPSQ